MRNQTRIKIKLHGRQGIRQWWHVSCEGCGHDWFVVGQIEKAGRRAQRMAIDHIPHGGTCGFSAVYERKRDYDD